MNPSDQTAFLRIPLYLLQDVLQDAEVETFKGFTASQVKLLSYWYSVEELNGIRRALAYASQQPDLDFKSLMPTLPQSNDDIAILLRRVHQSLLKCAAG